MIGCPGCGANLKFDILSQKMKCEYCNTTYNPAQEMRETTAGSYEETPDEIEVTVFTCPQCGAEMYSEDNSATAYCTYCGSDTVLEQKLVGIKRPARIIPFQKTKEECQEAIQAKLEKFPFASKVFRTEGILDRLRPVYVPYWDTSCTVSGPVRGTGKKEKEKGNDIITETYDVKCDSDSSFEHMLFDASVVFDDTLAAEIAPFPVKEIKKFYPTYLSGFYAEIADTSSSIYEEDAKQAANYKLDKVMNQQFGMDVEIEERPEPEYGADSIMLPVWFASVRSGKRVAYAVMNGVTGKVHCDLPIDIVRYFIATVIGALPIFVLLNLFLTVTPIVGMFIAAIAAFVIAIVSALFSTVVRRRNERVNDKGYREYLGELPTEKDFELDAFLNEREQEAIERKKEARAQKKEEKIAKQKEKSRKKKAKDRGCLVNAILGIGFTVVASMAVVAVSSIGFFVLIMIIGMLLLLFDSASRVMFIMAVIGLAASFGVCIFKKDISGHQAAKNRFGTTGLSKKKIRYGVHFPGIGPMLVFASMFVCSYIIQRDFVKDIYYYFGTTLLLASAFASIVLAVFQYNQLSTRPLPFLKEGKKTRAGALLLALVLCAGTVFAGGVRADAKAYGEENYYLNPETNNMAVVYDEAGLLTDEEEALLLEQIAPLTEYGNIGFVSGHDLSHPNYKEYREYAYTSTFDKQGGTVFFIDMTNRKVSIFSRGQNYKVISKGYANTITDNVYEYATDGDYYGCASEAFYEIGILLSGQRISQPMKYINNALLSLILSSLIVWLIVILMTLSKAPTKDAAAANIRSNARLLGQTKRLMKVSTRSKSSGSGGGGGGGGSSGGGGGGGGGGSHSF